jgi:hypothetical protein
VLRSEKAVRGWGKIPRQSKQKRRQQSLVSINLKLSLASGTAAAKAGVMIVVHGVCAILSFTSSPILALLIFIQLKTSYLLAPIKK